MKRLQVSRKWGWEIPKNAIYVGRPTIWNNPYEMKTYGRAGSLLLFRHHLGARPWMVAEARRQLKGYDLICSCPLDKPCHADILLELANS